MLQASRLQPNYFDAYNDLGATYNREGKYALAEKMFEFAVASKPEHINGLMNAGLNYLSKRDYEKACILKSQFVVLLYHYVCVCVCV